ncbi:MAG: lysylphosphatidylglycerol synthase transmembrane domain-containing protein [Acidimicrobiia bacterium]
MGNSRSDSPARAGSTSAVGSFGPRGRLRLFASRQPRTRRATDAIALVVSGASVVAFGLIAKPPSSIERAAAELVQALPGFLDGVWGLVWTLLPSWAVVLFVAALVRRRAGIARDIAIAATTSLAVASVTAAVLGGQGSVAEMLGASGPPAQLSPIRLAVGGAAILVAGPQLTRPFRRLGRWLVPLAALSAVLLEIATPAGAIVGLLIATVGAAATRLVFGSTDGRPSLDDVRRALGQLGVEADELAPADRQTSGVFVVGVRRGDERLRVKMYGRDAYDTQIVAKVWRALWYRNPDTSFSLTRLQQVEHEAFVSLYAANHGVPVPGVVTAGVSAEHDALLVLRGEDTPLRDLPLAAVDDTLLDGLWQAVARLHAAGVVHGNLDLEHLGAVDGTATIHDLGRASVIASDEAELADLAQLLVSTVVVAGEGRALACARAHMGDERLSNALSYVQDAAISPSLRRMSKAADVDLEELRNRVAETIGVELGQPVRLRRVSRAGLVRAALLSLGAYALLSQLGNIDFAELADALRDANWAWMILGFFVAQTPRMTQALSTRAASPAPIPFGPLYALQLAVSFVNLAIPSTVARVAVNVRFFQRQGLRAATAMTVGALDSFAEFLLQITILAIAFFTGASGIDLDIEPSSAGSAGVRILVAVAVFAVVACVTVVAVPRWRRAVVSTAREWLGQVRETLASLSATRFAQLIGANVATQLLFALSLGIFLAAFGATVPLLTLLVVNVSAALLAGLLPIPGGIGVTEGALIFGLTAAGVDETTAFAAVISYRIAVFYLPPIWGAYAFHWLERNRYL